MRPEIIHASCVALGPAGVLILGPSGAGKSALALELLACGGVLVADDRTALSVADDQLVAHCPAELLGKIEARGVGILAADTTPSALVRLVVDLGEMEKHRLPPVHTVTLLGQTIPLLYDPSHAHFPAAVLQYLKGGRIQ